MNTGRPTRSSLHFSSLNKALLLGCRRAANSIASVALSMRCGDPTDSTTWRRSGLGSHPPPAAWPSRHSVRRLYGRSCTSGSFVNVPRGAPGKGPVLGCGVGSSFSLPPPPGVCVLPPAFGPAVPRQGHSPTETGGAEAGPQARSPTTEPGRATKDPQRAVSLVSRHLPAANPPEILRSDNDMSDQCATDRAKWWIYRANLARCGT
jgi:hypothetical protein